MLIMNEAQIFPSLGILMQRNSSLSEHFNYFLEFI